MVEKLETSVNRGYVPKDLFLKRDLIPLVGMGTSMYRVFSNDFLSPNESFFDKKRKNHKIFTQAWRISIHYYG